MSSAANVVFVLGFVSSSEALAKNKVLLKKYGEKRAFYSCNKSEIDYLKYVEKGSKEPVDYVSYSGDDEKSLGVFNKEGLMSRKDKAQLRESLRATKSVIWHGIISFEEAFGKRYMTDFNEAQRLMKTEFPRFLKDAGFDPKKIEWFAGLHENTRYRHIHYSFFEKEPSKYSARSKRPVFARGIIDNRAMERFRVRIEQKLTDICAEIKIARKELTDIAKNLLFSPESKVRYQAEIQEGLSKLLAALPLDGRLGYESQNMSHLKSAVNKIVDNLIKLNKPLYKKFDAFLRQIKTKDANTLNILKTSKVKKSEWDKYLAADKTLVDLYSRLGNMVIKSARAVKAKERRTKNRLANKRIRRKTLASLIAAAIRLSADFEREASFAFEEFLRKLDEENEKKEEFYQYEME